MKINPLIHIGFHKTGTTWLQEKLFVKESNHFIPLSLKAKGPCTLAESFFKGNDGYLLSPYENNMLEIKKHMRELLNVDDFRRKIPVLSHERLSGNPHASGFDSKSIADRLFHAFPEGKIFIVIREQKSFAVSSYFQYLAVGGTHDVTEYLLENYDGRKPGFSPEYTNYIDIVSYYKKLFGNDKVLVLPYEMFRESPREFIERLNSFLNIDIDIPEKIFKHYVNKKKDDFVKYKLRKLNLFRMKTSLNNFSFLSNKFTQFLVSMTRKFLLYFYSSSENIKVRKKILNKVERIFGNRFTESNKELSQIINIDLSKYGYF